MRMMRSGIMQLGWLLVFASVGWLAEAGDRDSAAGAPNVFTEALELGQDIRSRRDAIERKVSDPAITSPEIAVARAQVEALTLRWSGKGSDAEKAETLQELEAARLALRGLVLVHPEVVDAVKALAADQEKLRDLAAQIAEIREAEKRKREQTDAGTAPHGTAE